MPTALAPIADPIALDDALRSLARTGGFVMPAAAHRDDVGVDVHAVELLTIERFYWGTTVSWDEARRVATEMVRRRTMAQEPAR